MYDKSTKRIPSALFKLYRRALAKSFPTYQPVVHDGVYDTKRSDRDCFDRWELIAGEITSSQSQSFLDIGCAEGFYVLKAGERGCFALGVDADVRRLGVAQNQLLTDAKGAVGFMHAVINPTLLEKLPPFDAVVFMSVMHHMMYTEGEAYCLAFLKKLRSRINKVMVFEMGQSNEKKNAWADKLPDMGANPHEWIKQFLLSAGFSHVEKIGESDSYMDDQRRAIFRVAP